MTDDHEVDIFTGRLGERLARLLDPDDVMMRRQRPYDALKRALLVIDEQDPPSLYGVQPLGFGGFDHPRCRAVRSAAAQFVDREL